MAWRLVSLLSRLQGLHAHGAGPTAPSRLRARGRWPGVQAAAELPSSPGNSLFAASACRVMRHAVSVHGITGSALASYLTWCPHSSVLARNQQLIIKQPLSAALVRLNDDASRYC
jgi:hypothetical protein